MIDNMLLFRGELAAMLAAMFWAISSVIYGRLGKTLSPLLLNLAKGLLAMVMICITLSFFGDAWGDLEQKAVILLLLSGVIGIGLGDTAYFGALSTLGPRRTLLLETLAPPMTGIIAWIWLGEILSFLAWSGIFITVLGVAWVISERSAGQSSKDRQRSRGIALGLIAAVCQSAGAVLSRAALSDTATSPLQSALIRLGGGSVVLLCWIIFSRQHRSRVRAIQWRVPFVGWLLLATLIGTFLGIWLQQVSLKFTSAGIAQTLLSTSPLFILPLAALMGEKITIRAFAGVILAIAGVSLLFAG